MILSDLKHYIKHNKRAHLTDLSNHFDVEPSAIRGMLETWVGKGKIRKVPVNATCGTGCCKCDPAQIEVYEWVDR